MPSTTVRAGFANTLLLALGCAINAPGQPPATLPRVTLGYSPQGAESLRAPTGKLIRGVQILQVTAKCQLTLPCTLAGVDVYQVAQGHGVKTISTKLGPTIINSTVINNKKKIAVDLIKGGSIIAAGLGAGGAIHMSAGWITGLILGHQIADQATDFLTPRIPDPTPLLSALIDAAATYQIPAGGGYEGFVLCVYDKSNAAFSVPLP